MGKYVENAAWGADDDVYPFAESFTLWASGCSAAYDEDLETRKFTADAADFARDLSAELSSRAKYQGLNVPRFETRANLLKNWEREGDRFA